MECSGLYNIQKRIVARVSVSNTCDQIEPTRWTERSFAGKFSGGCVDHAQGVRASIFKWSTHSSLTALAFKHNESRGSGSLAASAAFRRLPNITIAFSMALVPDEIFAW
jgi:hypothetical protein